MRCKTYVTPTSYLELIKTFKTLLNKKRLELLTLKDRYVVGLEKLEFSEKQISIMEVELKELAPKLASTSEETKELIKIIEKETQQVEETKKIVEADEAVAAKETAAAQAIKEECESVLAQAMPAMNAALTALDTLKQNDITIAKTMTNPPSGVKLVMESVCILKNIKPEKKVDSSGKAVEDYWPPAKKMLGDLRFLENLKEYDKDNIPPQIMAKIRMKYTNNPDFNPDIIKNVSSACEGLCKWVRALEIYDKVIKDVAPKRKKLATAEASLGGLTAELESKRGELKSVTDKLANLSGQLEAKQEEKANLESNMKLTELKIDRAAKLIAGLGGEKERWIQNVENLTSTYDNIVGDVLLSAAYVAYLGPFSLDYRLKSYESWHSMCIEKSIPVSTRFSLSSTLGDAVKIRDWQIYGLPVDK